MQTLMMEAAEEAVLAGMGEEEASLFHSRQLGLPDKQPMEALLAMLASQLLM